MPKDAEIIDIIKQAEREARDIRAKAEKAAREVFEKALKNAKLDADSEIIKKREQNKKMLENARKNAGEQIDCARVTAYENASFATKVSALKMQKAVERVITAVLEE